jgi:serine/threonine-protein kinase
MADQPDPNVTGAYEPSASGVTGTERFAPGAILSGRYRIIALLGKGGMGEVYRADDLTLGQSVALKFLPLHLVADPDRLTRFRKEVAAARRVSHPNVCRVYDIAEHAGNSFLTMEFVDGEDLGALLKRVGRLPEEKGIEIAHQLCSALAAVHELGLLHRDLKPANVLLDGRGQVRLTDFGLAAAAEDLSASEVRSGTPQYQSPEQLGGKEVTVRSDLFALGLVLYELFTGKQAFADLNRNTPPSKPSSHVTGLNPAVEHVILRCLEADPASRPRSANEVQAALPGGDPLAAAVAAGATPSPQLVADAGGAGTISLRYGLLAVAVVIISIILQMMIAERISIHRRADISTPPVEMSRKAREVLAKIGNSTAPADSAGRYEANWNWLNTVARRDPDWLRRAGDADGAMLFFYRESQRPMVPVISPDSPAYSEVEWTNPPRVHPGTAAVRLDPRGRLVEFYAILAVPPKAPSSEMDDAWAKALFAAAVD